MGMSLGFMTVMYLSCFTTCDEKQNLGQPSQLISESSLCMFAVGTCTNKQQRGAPKLAGSPHLLAFVGQAILRRKQQ